MPGHPQAPVLGRELTRFVDLMLRHKNFSKNRQAPRLCVLQPSLSCLFACALYAALVSGMASVALVLSILVPSVGNWWYLLTLLSPAAWFYYFQKGERVEQVSVAPAQPVLKTFPKSLRCLAVTRMYTALSCTGSPVLS